jgi:hypothetical protein
MTAVSLETRTALLASAPAAAAIWFPTPPGVTTLGAAPAISTNPTPQPPNAVAVPAGFDPANLQALFGTILPYAVAPVWPKVMTAARVLAPFNEEIPADAATTTALVVGELPYALILPGDAAALQTLTKLDAVTLLLVGLESVALSTLTGLDAQTWLQIGIETVSLGTTTQLGIELKSGGLLDTLTALDVVVPPPTVITVLTGLQVVPSTEVLLEVETSSGASDETYFNSWSWQHYEWDAEAVWPEGWAN